MSAQMEDARTKRVRRACAARFVLKRLMALALGALCVPLFVLVVQGGHYVWDELDSAPPTREVMFGQPNIYTTGRWSYYVWGSVILLCTVAFFSICHALIGRRIDCHTAHDEPASTS